MTYSDETMAIIISVFLTNGIVTRDDYPGLDSRPFARGLVNEMEKRGYTEVGYVEEHLEGFYDYTGALYDTEHYNVISAREYLKKYILC